MSDFNWQRVDDGSVVVKIETIMSNGGKNGEIIKTKTWSCYGRNLQFNAELGDSVSASWLDATSGFLLLLGVAGLALKRKCA